MSVKTYSLKTQGGLQVGPHFKVKEFACADGSDTVKIDSSLIGILENLREEFNDRYDDVYIRIGSGYRTASYNKRIGGAAGSYHLKGMAADIDVIDRKTGKEIDVAEVAKYLESRRVRGIGRYKYPDGTSWIHCDTRTSKSFWTKASASAPMVKVGSFWPTLREQTGGYTVDPDVKVMQGKIGVKVDGKFGPKTDEGLKAWQKAHGLVDDSVCGPLTWAKIWG